MAARKAGTRHRVGRVSYYQHHGSWYLYYRDSAGARRSRVGRSRTDAERAAAIKNAELLGGRQFVAREPTAPAATPDVALLLRGLLELVRRGDLGEGTASPPAELPDAVPQERLISITELRQEYLSHHESVLASALTTVRRYASATQHLLDFAEQEGAPAPLDISAAQFVRYLRTIEVAANGHPRAPRRALSERTIDFTLQTCGSMYRFGVEGGLLPAGAERTFRVPGVRRRRVRRTKPIFVFDAATELQFFRAADPWTFAVHFVLAKTGMRTGELAHTLIDDLDLEAGWLHVRGKPDLGWSVKTGTDRQIPLAPAVIEVLRTVIRGRVAGPVFRREKWLGDGPAKLGGDLGQLTRVAAQRLEARRKVLRRKLTRQETGQVLRGMWRDMGAVRSDRLRGSLIRVARKLGIATTCPKSWRHTFATLLQEANVDPLIRQITLGHQPARPEQSALGMTGVYTHTQPDVQHREILRALQLRPDSLELGSNWANNRRS